ncbi:hypothetical protein D1781_12615 [Amnibacterium setariae]|uniref:Uncharacterized protein n=1 Tax=Amnibacterium setariae TaxID=2306585 RepID=A0A3A1U1X2_9MICO|nr:hypothetical protein D1781_12615 [Amnibacterium setariae]
MDPALALAAAERALRGRPDAVVLVDGRSGSGKTTFAAALARHGALLRLDDAYPGWDGLTAAADALVDRALVPRAAGAPTGLRRWDWAADRPAEALRLPPGPLVVEGCGALSRRAAAFADLRIWVELASPERRARALDRDGEGYAPHWERWARQERAFIAREDPVRSADLVVDGRRFAQALFGARTGDVHYPRRP